MKIKPRAILLLTLVLTLLFPSLSHANPNKPNIVLIMADDLGYECITANGGESYKTPHLDLLAKNGVRFEQCHTQPLCTPSRVQLMTGFYNVRNYTSFGSLSREETTFAHLFKKAGYKTGVFGKWQLGRKKDAPKHFGFDESVLWQHTRDGNGRAPRYANPGIEINGEEHNYSKGEYGPDLINRAALDFITQHRSRPFFLYYPMILPHDPFQPTPDSEGWNPELTGEKANAKVEHFADMVAYTDKMAGNLIAKLDELKIRENTLVIFLGDNGTHPSVTSRFKGDNYRGGKGTTTARGTHVPMIASWPKVMREGRVCGDLINSVDFLPTLCAAAGIPVPKETDGISFLPQLQGEKGTPREWWYCWYSPHGGPNAATVFAATTTHKLYRGGRLFDLTEDPFERKPLDRKKLSAKDAAADKILREVIDQFENIRPAKPKH